MSRSRSPRPLVPLSASAFRRRSAHPILLAEARNTLALTQMGLAERAGVSRNTVLLLEAGRTYAMPGTRLKIASALGLYPAAIAWPAPQVKQQPA